MEGVMILDSYMIGGFDYGALIAGIIFAILGICTIALMCILASDEPSAILLMIPIFLFAVLSVTAFCETDTSPEEAVYKVVVDDSVPLNEFYSRYEVIGQEGLIYEVKEKTK